VLTLFVESNQGDEDTTVIQKLAVFGSGGQLLAHLAQRFPLLRTWSASVCAIAAAACRQLPSLLLAAASLYTWTAFAVPTR
jgi:hypothetical protein